MQIMGITLFQQSLTPGPGVNSVISITKVPIKDVLSLTMIICIAKKI